MIAIINTPQARRKNIVTIARRWLGTPYLHQASIYQVGTDCLGLIRGIWRETIGNEPKIPPAYSPDWAEIGNEEVLWNATDRYFIQQKQIDITLVGDVVLLRMKQQGVAKHLGILAQSEDGFATIIHAYSNRAVVETPLNSFWIKRIVAQFFFPIG